MLANELMTKLEELRRTVRTGDYDRDDLREEIWDHRELLNRNTWQRILIHTLTWEIFDGKGLYSLALERLESEGIVEQAYSLIERWSLSAEDFVEAEFPSSLSASERSLRHKTWRQRCMAAMAYHFGRFRTHHQTRGKGLESIRLFLEECLGKAGYACNGTRARMHFFAAQIHESNSGVNEASREYEQSLHFCIARAKERLQKSSSDAVADTERAFAIYCLGKLKLRMGQIELEQGRLSLAEQHAQEASLLLRVSRDNFLPETATLLLCRVERQKASFLERGNTLLERIDEVIRNLAGHQTLQLEAKIERIITEIYLSKNVEPREQRMRSFEDALERLNLLRGAAQKLGLQPLVFQSQLAMARTHARLMRWKEAHAVLNEALPATDKTKAELKFVQGRVFQAEGASKNSTNKAQKRAIATECFRDALRLSHPSSNFRISCQQHIAKLLLDEERVVEAKHLIDELCKKMSGVEDSYLQDGLQRLQAQLAETEYSVFTFGSDFSLDDAKEEVEKKYLLSVSKRLGAELKDILGNWKVYESELQEWTYDKFRHLVSKHFDIKTKGHPA